MPGLDSSVLDSLDGDLALRRLTTDMASDFILSPHYRAVVENLGQELWGEATELLRNGTFEPGLPIIEEVPKTTGVTRPGAILPLYDRVIYQALVDDIAPIAEQEVDRSRSFSHVLLVPDPNGEMFGPAHAAWQEMRSAVEAHGSDPDYSHALRADVAAYFERVYQHNLINLLHATGCRSESVNLLEKLLLAWMEKDSHGILQGLFPSDFLGNFYLCALDAELEVRGAPSVRLLDDLYIFFDSAHAAREGLVWLCRSLRKDGLHLNERKTSILEASQLIYEETQLDTMFAEAREEAELNALADSYGFIVFWDEEGEPEVLAEDGEHPDPDQIELTAVESLFEEVDNPQAPTDKIERFCLPLLGQAGSLSGVERAIEGFRARPHLSQIYAAYLAQVGREDPDAVRDELVSVVIDDPVGYDWQLMWALGALLYLPDVPSGAVTRALRVAQDRSHSIALRAVAAVFVGRNGNASQRRALKNLYADEPSEYVRSAVLYSSRYFPTPERRTCVRAWGGHSDTNSLVARTVSVLS